MLLLQNHPDKEKAALRFQENSFFFIRLRRKTPSFSYGDIRHSETYTVMFTICASIK